GSWWRVVRIRVWSLLLVGVRGDRVQERRLDRAVTVGRADVRGVGDRREGHRELDVLLAVGRRALGVGDLRAVQREAVLRGGRALQVNAVEGLRVTGLKDGPLAGVLNDGGELALVGCVTGPDPVRLLGADRNTDD